MNTVYAGAYNVDVQEYLDEYYVNGLITAEECAKKIQDRNVYVAERIKAALTK